MLLSQEIHNQVVLDLDKYIVQRSMKRDYPSLIWDKTQHSFHFFFFFICHAFGKPFYVYISYGLFALAISGNVSYFSTIVTFWWRMGGSGFIHIHCIFVFYFDGNCFHSWLRWSSLSISFINFLFKGELLLSEGFHRFSICSFKLCGLVVPSL